MGKHRRLMETHWVGGGEERAAVLSRLCAPWALNLGPQILVWSLPAPEGVGMA